MITRDPIDTGKLACDDVNGAVASFLGVVRRDSGAGRVVSIEYDAYDAMADRVVSDIVSAAVDRFDITGADVVHRVGIVPAGEPSLGVVVRAAHRAAAFDALRWIVDELKRRAPIWKKEHYDDGSSRWLG